MTSRPPDRHGVVVLGDLLLDVVLAPARPLEAGTDVPGRVVLRQGGSAATTARWLARLGTPTTLVTAVGRDQIGPALLRSLEATGLRVRARRVAGTATGRIGVVVEPGGERSFVADRGAADELRPDDLRPGWFRRARLLHLPAYSLLADPLRLAAHRATDLVRERGGHVSVDLSSHGPLLTLGRDEALTRLADVRPDVLFGTAGEADALAADPEALLAVAGVVVLKRGSDGALILARRLPDRTLEARPTRLVEGADTTGAGDAFDAGFLNVWMRSEAAVGLRGSAAEPRASATRFATMLWRAAAAGNQAAARQLRSDRPELQLRRPNPSRPSERPSQPPS